MAEVGELPVPAESEGVCPSRVKVMACDRCPRSVKQKCRRASSPSTVVECYVAWKRAEWEFGHYYYKEPAALETEDVTHLCAASESVVIGPAGKAWCSVVRGDLAGEQVPWGATGADRWTSTTVHRHAVHGNCEKGQPCRTPYVRLCQATVHSGTRQF